MEVSGLFLTRLKQLRADYSAFFRLLRQVFRQCCCLPGATI
ncbi:hypothetical protein ALQ88_102708 [Pseudomonas savastanoi]|nr:hypothetical protein ALQ88_102708 [Pseudomonas savastanoi]